MTRMTLNPQQAEFLEKYVLKHQWTASMKIADASKFVRRKGKIYELMSRLPSLHLDDAKKQMALADQLANQGDFTVHTKPWRAPNSLCGIKLQTMILNPTLISCGRS